MCGIIAAHSKNQQLNVNDIVVDQYQDQHSRGGNGFGAAITVEHKIQFDENNFITIPKVNVFRGTTEAKILLDIYSNKSPTILMHHRMPTSSENLRSQTHPIFVSNELFDYDYLIVHNGVITNSDALKTGHEKDGFKYTTELPGKVTRNYNDSESLAIEIAMFIEQVSNKVNTIGNAAYTGYQLDKKTGALLKIFYGRNYGNPLKIFENENLLFLSSEGAGTDVEAHLLHMYDLDSKETTKTEMRLENNYSMPVKNYQSSVIGYQEEDKEESIKYLEGAEEGPDTLKDSHEGKEKNSENSNEEDSLDSYDEEDALNLRYDNMYEELQVQLDTFMSSICNVDSLANAEYEIEVMATLMRECYHQMETYYINEDITRDINTAEHSAQKS